MPAGLRGPHGPPGNAEPGLVEAAERSGEAADVRQQAVLGHRHVLQHDLAGDRRPEAHLALDFRGGKARRAPLHDEAADRAVQLGPDDGQIRYRGVADPRLAAVETVSVPGSFRPGQHAPRVGSVVRLGQAEAADEFPRGEAREVFLPLFLAAVGMDGMHDQGRLHAQGGTVAAVHPLHLPREQAVADMVEAGAAVFFRQGGTQHAEFAESGQETRIVFFLPVRIHDTRLQFRLAEVPGVVAHQALLLGKL